MLNLSLKSIGSIWKNTTKEKSTIDQSAADPASNSQYLSIEREVIKDTPFTMVGTKKSGYFLTMGKHRVSQAHKTKRELLKFLNKKDWTLITAVMIAFIHDRDLVDKAYKQPTGENNSPKTN